MARQLKWSDKYTIISIHTHTHTYIFFLKIRNKFSKHKIENSEQRRDAVNKFATVFEEWKQMAKTTRCKDDNNVIQTPEAHSFVGRCTSGSIVFAKVTLIGYWVMLPSVRIFLPFHAELTVLARPISIRLDLVDVLSGTTRPGFEHDHPTAHSRIHTRMRVSCSCMRADIRETTNALYWR